MLSSPVHILNAKLRITLLEHADTCIRLYQKHLQETFEERKDLLEEAEKATTLADKYKDTDAEEARIISDLDRRWADIDKLRVK